MALGPLPDEQQQRPVRAPVPDENVSRGLGSGETR
jgi:hypothetical protein